MKFHITVVAVVALAACSRRAPAPPAVTPSPAEHVVVAPAEPAPVVPREPLGESIYDLGVPLEDARGNAIGLDIGRGHPTVISMFYGNCQTACPAIIGYLKNIAAEAGDDARIVLVTFDPERDTPARLQELVTTYGLDARWTLARPSTSDARTLAAVLGVKFRAIAGGEFAHNAIIVALDRDGRPMARIEGLGDNASIVAALK